MKEPPPRDYDRMAGAYCKPWCIYCRRSPGIDCADSARPTKWRRQIERNQLRRYLIIMEDEMSWSIPTMTLERRKAAEKQGYDAVIRPWSGGWEITGITGPGISGGATQARLIDDVVPMVREYVDCTLGLSPDDNPTDHWTTDVIPVRLTLDLEPHSPRNYGTRAYSTQVHDKFGGEAVELVEETTWWLESPAAE